MNDPQILLVRYGTLVSMTGWPALVREYIDETADAELPNPGPQDDRYLELEDRGELRTIAVVAGEELVGYAQLLVLPSQHHPFPVVSTDSLYLRKPWRKGRLGLDLLGAMRATAKREGAPGLTFMAPPGSRLDRICKALKMPLLRHCYWCSADE